MEWALLRGRATLGLPGSDADLLVRKDHLQAFEDVVFERGGVLMPAWMHPWHRFYLVRDEDSGADVELDVVTDLIYNRDLRLVSGLEGGCLDRRVKDDGLYVLDPTDTFWTVLLHCVLDKQKVTERRAAELEDVVEEVRRPSPGENFFRLLCPPDWSPNRVLACVRDRDWDSLARLGREISPVSKLAGRKPRSAIRLSGQVPPIYGGGCARIRRWRGLRPYPVMPGALPNSGYDGAGAVAEPALLRCLL